MAKAIKDAFNNYQTGLQEIYNEIPRNVKEDFQEFAESSDLDLS